MAGYVPLPPTSHLSGRELKNALQSKTEFTLAEWEEFGTKHVRMDHFVNRYGTYYRPAERITKEQIDALAKAITEYIMAHQDEVAQEENWRTKMQKEMARRFKQLQEENAAQSEQIAKLEKMLHEENGAQSEQITNLEKMVVQLLVQTARD